MKVIQEKKNITKDRLIEEVCKRQKVGSSTVRDILSQLYLLKIVGYDKVGRAQAHFVNEKNLGELKRIED